jgi:hypothetical protein
MTDTEIDRAIEVHQAAIDALRAQKRAPSVAPSDDDLITIAPSEARRFAEEALLGCGGTVRRARAISERPSRLNSALCLPSRLKRWDQAADHGPASGRDRASFGFKTDGL